MKIGIKKTAEPAADEIIFNNVSYRKYLELADLCKDNNYIMTIYKFELNEE